MRRACSPFRLVSPVLPLALAPAPPMAIPNPATVPNVSPLSSSSFIRSEDRPVDSVMTGVDPVVTLLVLLWEAERCLRGGMDSLFRMDFEVWGKWG